MMHRTPYLLARLALAVALCAGAGPLFAQAELCNQERDVSTKALDELTWKKLNAIYEDVSEEKYDEAYADLRKMLDRTGKDTYLKAVVVQALAQVEWSRGNYDASLAFFEQAVDLDVLPNRTHFTLMYQIAQLYFMKDRYDDALDRLDLWFCKVPKEEITAHAYVLKATILAQKGDYVGVLENVTIAISMEPEPKEAWYQLKLAAHYELKQHPEAAETLEFMITQWPDKKLYWTQLAQIHYQLRNEDRALAVLALAYRRNMLDKQSDLAFLSSLYSNSNVPYKAAAVLEKGIRDGVVEATRINWTATADAWYSAEEMERALAAYDEAGRVAEDGNIDLRRGYILVDMERWPEALEALNRSIEKGGLNERKTGEAYLLRGMAQFNLGRLDSASADWGRAGRYEKTRAAARQWMNHLAEERRRRAS